MADLPRYRPLGVSIGSMPSVNFVQTGKVVAQKYENIDRALGQISNYLYEQEVAKAKTAGARYGAEQAPTAEQLDKARQSGTGLRQMLPGDSDTVFGQAAQASALAVIEAKMEVSARNAITQLRIDAEQKDLSADEFQVQLNGLIDGYASSLAQIDPVSAVNFEASIAATANTNLLAHAQDIAEKIEAQESIAVEFDFTQNILPSVDMIISNGATRNADTGEVTTVETQLNELRNKAVTLALATFDEDKAESFIKRYDDRVLTATNTYMTNWAMTKPSQHLRQMRAGEFTDGRVGDMWNSMNDTQKDAVRKSVRDEITARNSLIASNERVDEINANNRVDELLPKVLDNIRNPKEDIDADLAEIRTLKPELYDSLIEVRDSKGGRDDADTIADLDRKKIKGELTYEDVIAATTAKNLTPNTADGYFTSIAAQRDKRFVRAMRMLSREYGSPDEIMLGRALKEDELDRLNELNDLINEMEESREDLNFDPMAFAKEAIKEKGGAAKVSLEIKNLTSDIDASLGSFPVIKQLKNTSSRIEAIEEMLAEEYEPGGLFSSKKGVSPSARRILSDILVSLRRLEKMEAGQ